MSLTNQHTLITGASQGLGLSIAQAVIAAGSRVTNWSRKAPTEPATPNPQLQHITCDCRSPEAIKKSWEQTTQPIDHFIYNAGVGYYGPLQDMPIAEWKKLMETNLDGAFYTLRHVIPAMQAQQRGHIVLIGSIAGKAGTTNLSAYCASKFALRGMAESLLGELRYQHIKLTYLAPASIETPFFDNMPSFGPNVQRMDADWVAESVVQLLQTPADYLPSYIEMRPLRPNPPANSTT